MRNDYKLIIFDMDGTILNTIDDLTISLNYAREKFGFNSLSVDEVKALTGNGIRRLVSDGLKDAPEDVIGNVFDCFYDHYKIHCNDNTRPYEGVNDTISALKDEGYLCAVLSNKVHSAVLDLCRAHFDGLFDYILGNTDGLKPKPDPDGIIRILDTANVEKKDALMVGDSDVDIQTGYNAGIDVVGATYGFRSEALLKIMGVKNLIHTPSDLLDLLSVKR